MSRQQQRTCNGEHADKLLPFRVPQRRGADPVLHEGVESLFHAELRIKDDNFHARRHHVVAGDGF